MVYDVTGRVIIQKAANDNMLDVSAVKPGVYYVEAEFSTPAGHGRANARFVRSD